MYTLVIVDMQSVFSASGNPRLRNNCKQEIVQAMENDASIIFVEMIGCNKTISSLTNLTNYYHESYIVRKDCMNGSEEVVNIIKAFKLPNKHIRICGVNTDQCVKWTMIGIHEKFKRCKIELVKNACNSSYKPGHIETLKEFKKHGNISVI